MLQYASLVQAIMTNGEDVEGRNGKTLSIIGPSIMFDRCPLLAGRKIYWKGIVGEFVTMLRNEVTKVENFKKNGCNYWDKFADERGNLNLDYGRAWYEPVNQVASVLNRLKVKSTSRQILIDSWRPENIQELTLPCCHFAYQFLVRGDTLNLVWYQRSCDTMVGLPSDMFLAWLMLTVFAHHSNLNKGTVVMHFGDCHIYDEHLENAGKYMVNFLQGEIDKDTIPELIYRNYGELEDIQPSMFEVENYNADFRLDFELKI